MFFILIFLEFSANSCFIFELVRELLARQLFLTSWSQFCDFCRHQIQKRIPIFAICIHSGANCKVVKIHDTFCSVFCLSLFNSKNILNICVYSLTPIKLRYCFARHDLRSAFFANPSNNYASHILCLGYLLPVRSINSPHFNNSWQILYFMLTHPTFWLHKFLAKLRRQTKRNGKLFENTKKKQLNLRLKNFLLRLIWTNQRMDIKFHPFVFCWPQLGCIKSVSEKGEPKPSPLCHGYLSLCRKFSAK
jgi:hypothetical protein